MITYIVFIGDTGSGKTTNMLYLLNTGLYDYLANDRIGFYVKNSSIYVIGFPSNIGVRASTVENNYDLKQKLICYFPHQKYKENVLESMENTCSKKLSLTICDIKEAFQCDSTFCAPLETIIFTEFDKFFKFSNIEKLDPSKSLSRLLKYEISSISKEQSYLNECLMFNVTKFQDSTTYFSYYMSYLYRQNNNTNKILEIVENNDKVKKKV